MLMLKSNENGNPETDKCDDSFSFLNSLQELKELRAQIHHAANYCEKSFLNAENKSVVLENTKEYLCRAVVTVVDHLGTVSSNLNQRIQKTDAFSNTDFRINCLKQKLDLYDEFNQSFTLTKIRRGMDLPTLYSRYISSPSKSTNSESNIRPREPSQPNEPTCKTSTFIKEFKIDNDMPLFMYTSSNKISLDISPVLPRYIVPQRNYVMPAVPEEFSGAPKLIRNPSFHFQESRKVGRTRRILQRKLIGEKETSSTVKRSKKDWSSRLLLKLKS